MSEFRENGPEQAAEAKVEEWKKKPVYLASSSQYRLNALKEMGFEDVHAMPAPEKVEDDSIESITSGEFGHDYSNKHVPGNPAFIARDKVKYLIEHNDIPEDAMVCAMDTAPAIFEFKEKKTDDVREGWNTVEDLGKPIDEADAKRMMVHIFETVGNGFKRFMETRFNMVPQELAGQEHMLLDTMTYGHIGNNIRVNSGMAVRFPNEKEVEIFGTEINMQPMAVWAIVANLSKDHDTYETLADKVIAAMKASGTAPEKVSGAIDYGNEEVARILGLEEMFTKTPPDDKEFFSGFPRQTFMAFIKGHAQEKI